MKAAWTEVVSPSLLNWVGGSTAARRQQDGWQDGCSKVAWDLLPASVARIANQALTATKLLLAVQNLEIAKSI